MTNLPSHEITGGWKHFRDEDGGRCTLTVTRHNNYQGGASSMIPGHPTMYGRVPFRKGLLNHDQAWTEIDCAQ